MSRCSQDWAPGDTRRSRAASRCKPNIQDFHLEGPSSRGVMVAWVLAGVQGGGGVGGCTGVASALVHGTKALAQSRSGGIHAVHAGCSGDLKQGIRTWRPRSGFANENTLAWKADTHIGACFQRKKKHQSGFWSTHGPLFICSDVRPLAVCLGLGRRG